VGAALFWSRAEWRRRWPSLTALGVGLGLAGAVVLTALAGAERTSTSYHRLVELTDRYDVQVQDDSDDGAILPRLGDLPGVVASDRVVVTFGAVGHLGPRTVEDMVLVAGEDDGFGRRFDRPVLEAGRMPDPRRPEELLLNNIAADALGAEVGDRLTVDALTGAEFDAFVFGGTFPQADTGARLEFTVTAIGRLPDDADAPNPAAIVSHRIFEATDIGNFDNQVWVRLADGQAGVDEFIAAAEALPEHRAGDVYFTTAAEADDRVIDTIAVQRVGLSVFALVALLVVAVAGGQALGRQLATSTDDAETLLALGLGRAGRVAALSLPFVAIALVAAVVVVASTVAASPILPVGFAGRLEPDPGVYVYPAILAVGALALIVFVVGVAAALALLRTRPGATDAAGADRPSRVTSAAAAAGAGPSVVTGLRLALEAGRGRVRLPVRSVLAGVALGAAGVAAVLTFGASLDRLLTDPDLHGQTWDVALSAGDDEDDIAAAAEQLARMPGVTAAVLADQRSVTIGGEELVGVSLSPVGGEAPVEIPYLEGRPPAAAGEVAIGPEALTRMGADVGGTVTALGPNDEQVRLSVVGSPLLAVEEEFDRMAVLTEAGLARLERSDGARNFYLDTRSERDVEQILGLGIEGSPFEVPVAIANLEEGRGVPVALAQFLAALAVAALVHVLIVGLRRRRRDVAVLRVLGLDGRQVVGLAVVQATTVALVGAAIGIPLGVAAGRWVWSEFAGGLNVVVRADVPVVALAAAGVGLLVVANLVAVPRGLVARRLAPSAVLRTE